MNRSAALSFLRQCSASVSSPAVARRSVGARTARALAARRIGSKLYSTTQNGNEEKKEDGVNEEEKRAEGESSNSNGNGNGTASSGSASEQNGAAAQGEDAHTECLKKLKSKEDEVVDLTSRLRYLQADFLNLQRNAAREKEQTRDFAITRFAGDLLETVDVLQLALKSVPESALKASNDAASQSTSTSSSAYEESSASASSSSTSSDSAVMSDSSTTTASSIPDSAPNSSPSPSKSALEYLRELHHGVEMTHRLLLQTLFKYGVKPFDPTGDAFDPNRHEALYQAPITGKKPGTVVDCQKTGYTIKDRTLRAAQVGVASEPPTPSS